MLRTACGVAALVTTFALTGCGGASPGPAPQDPAPPSAKTTISTTWAGDMSLELLSDGTLSTGLNDLYVRVTRSGATVTDAAVVVTPVMTLSGGNSQRSCPMIGTPTPDAEGLYQVRAVFQEPTGMMGHWDVYAAITRPGAAEVMGKFLSVPVAESGRAVTFSYPAPGTAVATTWVASLAFKAAPAAGQNPVEVTLHWMNGPMTFAPITDASITLEPRMPAMGTQVNPGSVAPVHVADGLYDGELALSMAGTWETTVTFSRGAETIGAPVFTTTF